MKRNNFRDNSTALGLIFLLIFSPFMRASAQTTAKAETYEKIEILSPDGENIREIAVRVRFNKDSLEIEATKTNEIIKKFNYSEIQSAEYSYTKKPRWKTGIG